MAGIQERFLEVEKFHLFSYPDRPGAVRMPVAGSMNGPFREEHVPFGFVIGESVINAIMLVHMARTGSRVADAGYH